jgi:hydrogenase maturation protease
MNIAIVGIGQPIRGDDGIGPAAVDQWSRDFRKTASDPRIKKIFLETPGFDILEILQGADAVLLVDAVVTGSPAGSLHILPSFPEPDASPYNKTSHEFGIAEIIAILRNAGTPLSGRFALLGIEIGSVKFGAGFSDPVRSAIPAAVQEIQKIVTNWLGE